MTLLRAAVHRTILVVDVEGFGDGRRTNPHRVAVRAGLYRGLRQAMLEAGIPWDDCDRDDCGDGVLVLAPAHLPKSPFVESLPHTLVEALREHNGTHCQEEQIRLRMALHAGEIYYDDQGMTGAAINLTFRLLEAAPLRTALATSSGVLAVITSSWFFDEVVTQCAHIAPNTYRPVGVAVKETDTVGWIYLPDADHPSKTRKVTSSAHRLLRRAPRSVLQDTLVETTNQLAEAVSIRWQREEEQRQIQDPFPLPIRWRPAPEDLTDHWSNICRVPAGSTSDPLAMTGQLNEIVDVYQQIPSRRLVVLGRAGSGKTILTLRFVLDMLKIRTRTDPVPVIFSLSSWNPTTTALRDWLAGQLVRDYPGLATTDPGRVTLADALVAAGRVLPVLDGFDEIADGLRSAALHALNATTLPLLLTSRSAEYAAAVAGTDVLTAAAGIELTDLTLTDLVNYLPRTTGKATNTTATVWDPVLSQLREQPQSLASTNLATVLTTPLMVALARTIYSDTPDHNPLELLNTDRFSTPGAVEDHLLDNFIPTVYRYQFGHRPVRKHTQWDLERIHYWLGYLAIHLNQLHTRDLAWWQLGRTLHHATRTVVVGAVAGLLIGLIYWLGIGPVDILVSGHSPPAAHTYGLVAGLVGWFACGFGYGRLARAGGVALEPSRIQLRIRNRRAQVRDRVIPKIRLGLAGGLVIGLVWGFVTGSLTGLSNGMGFGQALNAGLIDAVVLGLVYGPAVAYWFGFMAWFEAPLDIRSAVSPPGLLRANRATVLSQLLVWAPMAGLVSGIGSMLTSRLLQPSDPLGPLMSEGMAGAVSGLVTVLGYGLSLTPWGNWIIISRIWLPLTGRLPWAVTAFLDDACQRGVLRQTGAVYQFRHARLQEHLTGIFQARRNLEPASSH